MKKIIFIPWPISDIWRHLYTLYCWFPVIVSLECCFKHSEMFFSRWRCSLKLLNMTNKTFWKYPRSQHILLLWLLLLINHCYKHLDWFFRKSWSWLKLLNMIRETYWKNHFYIPCPNFNVLRHLLVFTNFSTKLSF